MIKNPTKFYITRHGETDWNEKGIVQGLTDIPLNKKGENQANSLRIKLKKIHFDQIFSSDLLRAKRTAQIIALEKKMAVQTTKSLREGTLASYEGTNAQEFFELFGKWSELSEIEKRKHNHDKKLQEVESYTSMTTRFIVFFRETAIAFRGQNILVVTHGGILAHFMSKLGYGPNHKVRVDNVALVQIDSDGIEFEINSAQGVRVIQ